MNFLARCTCVAAVVLSVTAHAQETDPTLALFDGPALSRRAYVAAVLRVNPSVAVARETWRAALSRVRQAGALEDPMLEGSVAPLSIGSSTARFGFEVGLRQTLPWFGKRELERNAMSADAAASASDLESTRRELAMTAVMLYTQYYVALQSLEINARHTELLKFAREAATAQVEAGRGSVQDVLQAELESAQLERSTLQLATERDLVVAQMNQLLNRDPAAVLPPPTHSLEVEGPPKVHDAKQLATEALRTRPEIASARLQAHAQSLKAEAARREYFPSITLSTSYSSMWDMPQHRWMLGVGINVPLPNERRAGAIDEARATQARYESDAARMSSAARTEVFIALRRLGESDQVLSLFNDRLLPLARERVEASQAGLVAARTTFASVIEAQRGLRTVELEHMLAQAEHIRRSAELERVLGRIPGLGDSRIKP